MQPMRPEIGKIMTLGACHISRHTGEMLDREPDANVLGLSVYPKTGDGESYGWYIYLPSAGQSPGRIPSDLGACLQLADGLGCGILCLDRDGPELEYMQRFSWDDPVCYHVFADGYCAEREKMDEQEIEAAEARHGKLLFMTEKC